MMCISVSRAWNEFEGKGLIPLIIAKYNNWTVCIFETEINFI